MTEGKVAYEQLDHTADVAIVVRAPELEELFERCAAAMFDLMVDLDTVRPGPVERRIELDAPDREALLVEWLGELLSLAMAEDLLFSGFDVRLGADDGVRTGASHADATALTAVALRARVRGEPVDPERHPFDTELKAVTHHHLALARDEAGFSARIVFDI
jgi:SHS2 domain-containing protein